MMSRLFLGIALITSLALPAYSHASKLSRSELNRVVDALNMACGDNWCDGGDWTFEFKSATFFAPAKRLTLHLNLQSGVSVGAPISRKCVFYNFAELDQMVVGEEITRALSTEVSNCLDTLLENLAL